jgi:hypothetical protein
VTLSAAAASGSSFGGWGGACSGTSPSCTLTLNANAAVSASFVSLGPPPKNVTPPKVTGTPSYSQQLHCTGDTWSGLGAHGILAATWFESYVAGGHGTVVHRVTVQVGTGRGFTVPDYVPGAQLYCSVIANGLTTATSASVVVKAVAPVLDLTRTLLVGGKPGPTIDATVPSGQFNHCTTGTWLHYPTRYTYAWYVVPSPFATTRYATPVGHGSSLLLDGAEENGYLVCAVTASNAGGSATALSNRYWVAEPDLGFQINGIELNQGVQTGELPTRNGLNEHVSYKGVPVNWSAGQPVKALLSQGHATVVRVYVSAPQPISGHAVPTMMLSATRNGVSLGHILPDQLPPASAIQVGGKLGYVSPAQQFSPTGAYTFTLPQSWTSGDVTFTASLTGLSLNVLCGLPCSERRTIILGPEHFNPTTRIWIDQLAFVVYTGNGPCPGSGCVAPAGFPGVDPVWNQVQAVTGVPIDVHPLGVALDGTDVVNAISHTDGFPCLTNCTHSRVGDATDPAQPFYHWQLGQLLPMVTSWGDSNDNLSSHYPFALTPNAYTGCCFSGGGHRRSDLQRRSEPAREHPARAVRRCAAPVAVLRGPSD